MQRINFVSSAQFIRQANASIQMQKEKKNNSERQCFCRGDLIKVQKYALLAKKENKRSFLRSFHFE